MRRKPRDGFDMDVIREFGKNAKFVVLDNPGIWGYFRTRASRAASVNGGVEKNGSLIILCWYPSLMDGGEIMASGPKSIRFSNNVQELLDICCERYPVCALHSGNR